jgi:hypothetical protein
MSASVFVYTKDGFIIGSDGRSTLGHDSPEVESDEHTKIFRAQSHELEAAYVLNGLVGQRQSPFDLIADAQTQVAALSLRRFDDVYYYATTLSRFLKRRIGEARRDGLIARFPENPRLGPLLEGLIATLFLVGYSRGYPFFMKAEFIHRNQEKLHVQLQQMGNLRHGDAVSFGCESVMTLIEARDQRFSKYLDRININLRTASFDEAVSFVEAVIASQSDDVAREVAPESLSIGGHTHIATVAPQGFRWIIPPKSSG